MILPTVDSELLKKLYYLQPFLDDCLLRMIDNVFNILH